MNPHRSAALTVGNVVTDNGEDYIDTSGRYSKTSKFIKS